MTKEDEMNEYSIADLKDKIRQLNVIIIEEVVIRAPRTGYYDESMVQLARMKRTELQNRLNELQEQTKDWMNW